VPTPPHDPWTVAIYRSSQQSPVGTGVVVDHKLVLTCTHVVSENGAICTDVSVGFPKAPGLSWNERRQVQHCVLNGMPDQHIDLALLELASPVPGAVTPARLRCLPPEDLRGGTWWCFGFPHGAAAGSTASGEVSDALAHGQIYLEGTSKSGLTQGFSGGPLWSFEYQAVVGIVVSAGAGGAAAGDGHALTLYHADLLMPEMKLSTLAGWRVEAADESALAAWGWALAGDPEAGRHWLPRARGVAVDSERGARFRGRTAALRRLVEWLDQPVASGRPLVVTGSPGVGKSAVLGRIVTTADPDIQKALPAGDDAVRATVGSVACAVHVKGKSAQEVAVEIARAAGVALPRAPADIVSALRERLTGRQRRFNLIVDALDEAVTAAQARVLINDVIRPLAQDGASTGIQVAVGTRRADSDGGLLAEFGSDVDLVDLDDKRYFAESDLAAYALATLQLLGAERPGNPYADTTRATPVAARIARLASGNFLVAGLIARARGLRDIVPINPDKVAFTGTVADALDTYLAGLPPAGQTSARLALTALAYANTPGLPVTLWCSAVRALGGTVTDGELSTFARTSAANFLIERGSQEIPVYRLFHQALNDALLDGQRSTVDEERLVRAWIAQGREMGWANVPEYLRRSLPAHAARTGLVDELLCDDGYLLYGHLRRLMPAAEWARTEQGWARAQLLQRTPLALGASAGDRAAMFSVVDRLDRLDTGLDPGADAPYRARWACTPPRLERTVLEGHSDAVYDVCAVPVDGRSLLASAGEDGTVRLWDPLTNQTERVLSCHDACIHSVYAVRSGSTHLLATASHDKTVGLWDPRTGRRVHHLTGHTDWVRNLCVVPLLDGRELLASASDDRTVRLWDPVDGSLVRTLSGHAGWVTAVCHVPAGPHGLVASTGFDGTIRIWDPVTGTRTQVLTGHVGWVTTLTKVPGQARALIASAGYDGTVRVWDPASGAQLWICDTRAGALTDLCTLHFDGAVLLVAAGEDGVIRLWEAPTGKAHRELRGYVSWIRAICELRVGGGRHLLATAGDDGTVRLWDPSTGEVRSDDDRLGAVAAVCGVPGAAGASVASAGTDGRVLLWDPVTGERLGDMEEYAPLNDICAVVDAEYRLLATAGDDNTVQLWDIGERDPYRTMRDHHERVNAVCALVVEHHMVVASGSEDAVVRLWNVSRGETEKVLLGHHDWVTALCTAEVDGRQLLASADKSGMLRLWDPEAALLWEQHGHPDGINALCSIRLGRRDVLVSAGEDRQVRLWEPRDGKPIANLSGHSAAVTGICPVVWRDRTLLASTSLDRTARIWDPATARTIQSIPTYHRALACEYVADTLIVGLDHGLLALVL